MPRKRENARPSEAKSTPAGAPRTASHRPRPQHGCEDGEPPAGMEARERRAARFGAKTVHLLALQRAAGGAGAAPAEHSARGRRPRAPCSGVDGIHQLRRTSGMLQGSSRGFFCSGRAVSHSFKNTKCPRQNDLRANFARSRAILGFRALRDRVQVFCTPQPLVFFKKSAHKLRVLGGFSVGLGRQDRVK